MALRRGRLMWRGWWRHHSRRRLHLRLGRMQCEQMSKRRYREGRLWCGGDGLLLWWLLLLLLLLLLRLLDLCSDLILVRRHRHGGRQEIWVDAKASEKTVEINIRGRKLDGLLVLVLVLLGDRVVLEVLREIIMLSGDSGTVRLVSRLECKVGP